MSKEFKKLKSIDAMLIGISFLLVLLIGVLLVIASGIIPSKIEILLIVAMALSIVFGYIIVGNVSKKKKR